MKVKNPSDANGFVTKFMVCRSIYHWAKDCPDRNAMYTACQEEEVHSTLFSKTVQECYVENFLGETLSYAILDSGCTKSVCSRVWLQCYLDALNESDKSSVQEQESSSKFKFGDGVVQTSLKKVIIPANINGTKVKIETDVIDNSLPLLLSKSAMQKAATKIDFKNNKVTMFGKVQDLHFTTSGHYCILLDRKHKIISYEDQNATKVMSTNTLDNKTSQEKKSVAVKLHKQFCHSRTFRSRKLLQDGGVSDEEFLKLIEEVEKTCDICCKYKRPPSKPVVCFPLSKEFNESVAMDIKYCENHLVLHLIDHATRFSSAAIIISKHKDTIISKVFQIWIFIFGPPKQILTDNGGEFTSDDFREMGEKLNTTIKTTAAESPWSNGINERHNAIMGNMAQKVHNETKCSMDIAIASAVSSKNASANVHGYSPNQLVFGYNPNFPFVLSNKLPAMESKTSFEIVLEHLTALHCTRKAFVESEASERLNRAIKKRTRSSTALVFQNGDSVYYKRDGSHEWKGLGKVPGTDSQTVLIKHGSIYVRVHPC